MRSPYPVRFALSPQETFVRLAVPLALTVLLAAHAAGEEAGSEWIRLRLHAAVLDDPDARARVAALSSSLGFRPGEVRKSFPSAAPGFPHHALKARLGLDRWVDVRLGPGADPREEIRRWGQVPGVEVAEPLPVDRPALVPNDPLFPQQWEHDNTGANPGVPPGTPGADLGTVEAWDLETGSVLVANLESVDWYHEDLVNNVWQNLGEDLDGDGVIQWDSTAGRWVFDPDDVNFLDDDGNGYRNDFVGWNFDAASNFPEAGPSSHGTATAGFLLARPDNGQGVAGVCRDCRLIAVPGPIGQSMIYAIDRGAVVLSVSRVGAAYTQAFEGVLEYAHALGVVVVVGAGNDGDEDANPYCLNEKVICVGATDPFDRTVTTAMTGGAWGSDWGPLLDVAAPGIHLTFLQADSGYASGGSGTSFSTPLVAGVAALVKSSNPALSPDEVASILQSTADPFVAADRFAGMGRVDARRAVEAALQAAALGSHPVALIQTLTTEISIDGTFDVHGTADSPDFASYRVRIGEGFVPTEWLVDEEVFQPVRDSLLASTNVATFAESTAFRVELEVRDIHGQVAVDACHPVRKLWTGSDFTGWPVVTSAVVDNPTMGDVDGDGSVEIVYACLDSLDVRDVAGQSLPGWPLTGLGAMSPPPALVDLDGDGDVEIVVAFVDGQGQGQVAAYEADASPAAGWPRPIPAAPNWNPVSGDVDGDGEPEIVQYTGLDLLHEVHVLEADGAPAPGWPRPVSGLLVLGPVLAELDGDDGREIVVSTLFEIHAFDADGLELPGWPMEESVSRSPVAVDLDADGLDEVVRAWVDTLSAHHADGSLAAGWPRTIPGATDRILVADLDGDGTPEILVESTVDQLHVLGPDGSSRPGWPRDLPGRTVAALVDADGDPDVEIVHFGSHDVAAIDPDGSVAPTWPFVVSAGATITDVIFGDATGDGTLEMLFAADPEPPGNLGVKVLQLAARGGRSDASTWSLTNRDPGNTRRFVPSPPTGVSLPATVGAGFAFDPPAPNPSGGPVRLSWTLPHPGRVRLRIFDVTGRLVTTVAEGSFGAGDHVRMWDGTDSRGRAVSAGIYFVRLEAPPHGSVHERVGIRR